MNQQVVATWLRAHCRSNHTEAETMDVRGFIRHEIDELNGQYRLLCLDCQTASPWGSWGSAGRFELLDLEEPPGHPDPE